MDEQSKDRRRITIKINLFIPKSENSKNIYKLIKIRGTIFAKSSFITKLSNYGIKLLTVTPEKQTAYSPILVLSTVTALAKNILYFFHKTTSMLKRKKQRKQLFLVLGAAGVIYFLPVITQLFHQLIATFLKKI